MGSGYKHFAGLKGSKLLYVGADPDVYAYQTIQSAVDAADSGATILLEPGTYTQTTKLSVTKNLTIRGLGTAANTIITSALTTRTVEVNMPATGGAAQTVQFERLTITNSSAGAGDSLYIDNNGGAAYDLTVNVRDCNVTVTGTGYAINLVHTTGTKDIMLYVSGSPLFHTIGKSYLEQKKALSAVVFHNVYLSSDVTVGNNAVAATTSIIGCMFTGAALTTGGNAANITNYIGNYKATAAFKAALANSAATDFDAAGTEYAGVFA